jgi:pyruvate,orthophosphate dikinase
VRQGEDVVAGIRTPMKLEDLKREAPQVFELLLRYERALEEHFRDVQVLHLTCIRHRTSCSGKSVSLSS